MINVKQLDDELSKSIDDFASESRSILECSKCNEDVKYDLEQLARQVFYTLSEFQKSITKHLKNI